MLLGRLSVRERSTKRGGPPRFSGSCRWPSRGSALVTQKLLGGNVSRIGPSQARNAIKRALYGILDHYPTGAQIDELWEFFESRCAYCGEPVDKVGRQGHVDHLVAVATGGSNHISNCVLACGKCNGDFKREMDWESFILKIYNRTPEFIVRRGRILRWVEIHSGAVPHRDPSLTRLVEDQIAGVLDSFNVAVERIRSTRLEPKQ
jgi:HNH endonuclease